MGQAGFTAHYHSSLDPDHGDGELFKFSDIMKQTVSSYKRFNKYFFFKVLSWLEFSTCHFNFGVLPMYILALALAFDKSQKSTGRKLEYINSLHGSQPI